MRSTRLPRLEFSSMRALRLENGELRFDDRAPDPVAPPGESLIRVTRAGICETDLQLVRGYMGFHGILGHEFVGIAESGPYAGNRVVGEINCGCGTCEWCEAGRERHCPNRTVLGILRRDGAFADFVTLPHENLHLVPDAVPDDIAVFVEPLAAAYRVVEQLPIGAGVSAIVLGDGRLGNLCAQVLAQTGAAVLAVGKHDEKLSLLRDCQIDTARLEDMIADLDAGRWKRADVVVEATGSPTGLPLALRLVRPRGTVVLKTTVAGEQTFALAPIVIDEVNIIGSRCGPFEPAIRALAEERTNVRPLISAVRPFEEVVEAFDEATQPGVLKVQLVM